MNTILTSLQEKIKRLKMARHPKKMDPSVRGYDVALIIMTDLLSCILVGLGIGLFLQKFFHTSVLITAGLSLLGGIAGLYTVIRFAMNEDKRNSKC